MNGWIYLFFFFMLVKVQIIWIWSKNGCAAFTYQLNKLFSTNCFCRFKHILFTSLTKAASFVNPNKVGESLYPLPPFQLVFPWKLRHGKSSNPGILQHSLNFRLNNVFFFRSRPSNYWYSVWVIRNLWGIWLCCLCFLWQQDQT